MMSAIKRYLSFQTSYSDQQWKWLKIPFIIFWFGTTVVVLWKASDIVAPTSICKFFDCSVFLSLAVKIMILSIAFTAVISYILEKRMLLSTAVLSIISVLIFTLEDSQGIFNRNDILSGILIAQFLAYLVFRLKKSQELLNKQRIFFSQQIIIAIYFLSGLSKIISSGFFWFTNPQGFAIQVQKSNMNKFIDYHNESYIAKGEVMTTFILSHPNLISSLLFLTLFIELGVVITLFINKKWMIFYGVLLLCLHIGIWFFMSIVITPIIVVNLIFLVNALYLMYMPINQLVKNKA